MQSKLILFTIMPFISCMHAKKKSKEFLQWKYFMILIGHENPLKEINETKTILLPGWRVEE